MTQSKIALAVESSACATADMAFSSTKHNLFPNRSAPFHGKTEST